jgi:hypothetical protein
MTDSFVYSAVSVIDLSCCGNKLCQQVWKLVLTVAILLHCPLLCVAKDETSVGIMCRRFCSNFLRKSRLWQIWLARRLTPDVSTVYIYIYTMLHRGIWPLRCCLVDEWELLACRLSLYWPPFLLYWRLNWQIPWTLMDGPAGLASNIVEN